MPALRKKYDRRLYALHNENQRREGLMIIVRNTAEKRVLINIGKISHIEEFTNKLLIFIEGGEVVCSPETWEEVIMKIKSIGANNV